MPLASAKPGTTKDPHRVTAAKAVPFLLKPRMALRSSAAAAAAAPRIGCGIGKGSYHKVPPDGAGPPSKKARLESSAPAAAVAVELGPAGPPSKKARLESSAPAAAVAVELGPGPPSKTNKRAACLQSSAAAAAVAVPPAELSPPPPPSSSWSRRSKFDKNKPPPIQLTDDEFDEEHSASAVTKCSCSQCAHKAQKSKWQDATRLASDSRFSWLAHKATGLGCVLCNKKTGPIDAHSQYAFFQVSDGQNNKRVCKMLI